MDAEPIIRDQHWFHTYSYLLLADDIMFILSTLMIIFIYDMSLIYYYGCGFIESAGVVLFYRVFLVLYISLFMVFTSFKIWRRVSYYDPDGLKHTIELIKKSFRLIERRLYGLRNEMWYIFTILNTIYNRIYNYLMNNSIFINNIYISCTSMELFRYYINIFIIFVVYL